MPPDRERQLILAVQEGSHDAFRELVELHMRRVYDLAYGFVNDHDDAEDVAQEAFVKAYHALGSFRQESGFSTWLYRITTNSALDRLKQKKRSTARFVPMEESDLSGMSAGQGTDQGEQSMMIERALHELPTLQRAVVMLRHIDGFSTKQVSDMLKCSEGTVKTHLHRGLRKMRMKLEHLKDDGS
ncbi:MAG: RNA polymerase sigma factor [Ignavibacteriales bacterium]|nr:RNA polymerase sigma factor [Ignavibacteriales bacterium]